MNIDFDSDSASGQRGMGALGGRSKAVTALAVGLAVAFFFNSRPGEAAHHRRSQHLAAAIYEDLGLVG